MPALVAAKLRQGTRASEAVRRQWAAEKRDAMRLPSGETDRRRSTDGRLIQVTLHHMSAARQQGCRKGPWKTMVKHINDIMGGWRCNEGKDGWRQKTSGREVNGCGHTGNSIKSTGLVRDRRDL